MLLTLPCIDEALDMAMIIGSAGSYLVWHGRFLALTLAGLFLTWLGPGPE